MRRTFLAALCVAFSLGTSATASDMRIPVRAPAVVLADDWSGF